MQPRWIWSRRMVRLVGQSWLNEVRKWGRSFCLDAKAFYPGIDIRLYSEQNINRKWKRRGILYFLTHSMLFWFYLSIGEFFIMDYTKTLPASVQNNATQNVITFFFVGLDVITGIICAALLHNLDVEKVIKQEQLEILQRKGQAPV